MLCPAQVIASTLFPIALAHTSIVEMREICEAGDLAE